MSPQELVKNWPVAVLALLIGGGGGFGGSMVFANSSPTRTEVKMMIEDNPKIIVLQKDMEHLIEKQANAAKENKEDHKAIMDLLEDIRSSR
jgi:hypothetical protein